MINLPDLRSRLARQITQPAIRLLAKTGVTPNTITALSLVVAIAAAVTIAWGFPLWGGIIMLVAGLFDILDGALARATQRTSRFGAFFDSTVDRVAEAAVLLGILVWFTKQGSTQGVLLAYVAVVGGILVSYSRARAEGLGLDCKVGLFTRAERIIVLAIGLLANQIIIALWIVSVLSYFTLGQRLFHVWRQTRARPDK